MDFSVDDFNFASLKKKSASGSGSGLKNLSKRLKRGYGYSQKIPPDPFQQKNPFPCHPSSYSIDLSFVNPFRFFFSNQMGVSENSGFSHQIIHQEIGFSILNHPFWGTPIFGNTQMKVHFEWKQ